MKCVDMKYFAHVSFPTLSGKRFRETASKNHFLFCHFSCKSLMCSLSSLQSGEEKGDGRNNFLRLRHCGSPSTPPPIKCLSERTTITPHSHLCSGRVGKNAALRASSVFGDQHAVYKTIKKCIHLLTE